MMISLVMFGFFKKFKNSHRVHKTLSFYGVDPKYTSQVIRGFNFDAIDIKYVDCQHFTDLEYTLVCLIEVIKLKERAVPFDTNSVIWLGQWIELLLSDSNLIRTSLLDDISSEFSSEESSHWEPLANSTNTTYNKQQEFKSHTVVNHSHRSTYCWHCHGALSSSKNRECGSCGWLICQKCCSCSVGCNTDHIPSASQKYTEEVKKPVLDSQEQLRREADKLFNGFYQRVSIQEKLTPFDNKILAMVVVEPMRLDSMRKELIFGHLSSTSVDFVINHLGKQHRDAIVSTLEKENRERMYRCDSSMWDYDDDEPTYEDYYFSDGLSDSNS